MRLEHLLPAQGELMRRLALAALLALGLAGPAAAATKYVNPAGAGPWATAGNPLLPASMVTANASVSAGDSVVMQDGTYADPIQPHANGTTGARIVYAGNPANPSAVVVPKVLFGGENTSTNQSWGDFVTVRWCYSQSGLLQNVHLRPGKPFYACDNDLAIRVLGLGSNSMCGTNTVYDSCSFAGTGSFTMEPHPGTYPAFDWQARNNTIKNSTLAWSNSGSGSGNYWFFEARTAKYLRVLNNDFIFTATHSNSGYLAFFQFYLTQYMNFNDNRITIIDNSTTSGTKLAFSFRDSTRGNQVLRNTVTISGTAVLDWMGSNGGSFSGTVRDNRWEGNTIKIANPSAAAFYYQNGASKDTLRFNVIATSAAKRAFATNTTVRFDSVLMAHNTFIAANGVVVYIDTVTAASGSKLVSNVLYGTAANTQTAPTLIVPTTTALDSAGLFFNRGGSSGAAIYRKGTAPKAPAASAGYGIATKAVWNTPGLVDSVYATLNAHLSAGSPADDDNLHDGYAGALGVASPPPSDIVAPSAIGDLSAFVGQTFVDLAWTAVGDDGLVGTAASYDMRYSTSTITSGNFASATQATGEPTPGVAGVPEGMTVNGLTPGQLYYFAIKTIDDAGNPSDLSNVASATPGTHILLTGLTVTPTYEAAEVELGYVGDVDHDATVRAFYRLANTSNYDSSVVLDTVKVQNAFMGSLRHLIPGREYDVLVEVIEPDGGDTSATVAFTTNNWPDSTANGTFWVAAWGAGSDSASGTEAQPTRTAQRAWALAGSTSAIKLKTGPHMDTLLVAAGTGGTSSNARKLIQGEAGAYFDGSDPAFLKKSTYDSLTISSQKVYFIRGFTYWPMCVVADDSTRLFRHATLKALVNDSLSIAEGWFRSLTGDTMYVQLPSGGSPNGRVMHYAQRSDLVASKADNVGVEDVGFRYGGSLGNESSYANLSLRAGVFAILNASHVYARRLTFFCLGINAVEVDSLSGLGPGNYDILIERCLYTDPKIDKWGATATTNTSVHRPVCFIGNAHGLTFQNNTIWHFKDGGFRTDETVYGHLSNIDVQGNSFAYNTDNAVELDAWNGTNVRVTRNRSHAVMGGNFMDCNFLQGPNYIDFNTVTGFGAIDAITTHSNNGSAATDSNNVGRVYVRNNTFFSTVATASTWGLNGVTKGWVWENNILGGKATIAIDDYTGTRLYKSPGNEFNWNLYYVPGATQFFKANGSIYAISDSSTFRTQTGWEKNGRIATAFAFVDSTTGNYRTSDLNALDRGRRIPGINTEVPGRPFKLYTGTAPDLGALEFDVERPAPTVDLRVLGVGDGTVTLGWTSAGDDSLTGTPATYLFNWTFGLPCSVDWELADADGQAQSSNVSPAGAQVTFTFDPLNFANDVPVYFTLFTLDEAGNPSAVSNCVVGIPSATPVAALVPTRQRDPLVHGRFRIRRR
jgi:hypothetical protein